MRNPTMPLPPGSKQETQGLVLSTAAIQEHEVDAPPPRDLPLTMAAPVIGDATSKGDQSKNDAEPTVQTVFAEVLEDKTVYDGSTGRVKLKAGKVLSSVQYNLKDLHRQGVKLKRVESAKVADPTDFSFLS